jgi:hypothetical protein
MQIDPEPGSRRRQAFNDLILLLFRHFCLSFQFLVCFWEIFGSHTKKRRTDASRDSAFLSE